MVLKKESKKSAGLPKLREHRTTISGLEVLNLLQALNNAAIAGQVNPGWWRKVKGVNLFSLKSINKQYSEMSELTAEEQELNALRALELGVIKESLLELRGDDLKAAVKEMKDLKSEENSEYGLLNKKLNEQRNKRIDFEKDEFEVTLHLLPEEFCDFDVRPMPDPKTGIDASIGYDSALAILCDYQKENNEG